MKTKHTSWLNLNDSKFQEIGCKFFEFFEQKNIRQRFNYMRGENVLEDHSVIAR